MRPSQSVHIGQMSVVVMGSPGVGKDKDNLWGYLFSLNTHLLFAGKTSLLLTVSTNSFPRDRIPTLYDKLEVDVQVEIVTLLSVA